jgi:hypothetical protein
VAVGGCAVGSTVRLLSEDRRFGLPGMTDRLGLDLVEAAVLL